MSDYRRAYIPGGTFFFTVVTEHRAPLFFNATARNLLGKVMRQCFLLYPVQMVAVVLLPDHLHTIWTMPVGDAEFSMRWGWIKKEFSKTWIAFGGEEQRRNVRRRNERRLAIWQRRFWEHMIRDENDLENHFDYIHYNPVKHKLVQSPVDWPWSSFHRWVQAGHYLRDWAATKHDISLPGNAGE
jgi:putative transposase